MNHRDTETQREPDLRFLCSSVSLRLLVCLLLLPNLFHHRRNQLLCICDSLHDDLNVHGGLTGLPGALAIHPVLTNHREGICQRVECDRQPSSRNTHTEFIVLQLFALFIQYAHNQFFHRVIIVRSFIPARLYRFANV